MRIISISGLDGSGKSTQIELLQQHLESQEKKVFYFHAGQFSISKTYNILRPHKVITKTHKESVTKASWLQIQLRKVALFIDLLRFKKLLRKLEKAGYDCLLSDRYFYDSLININYLSQNSPLWKRGKCERVQHLREDSKNFTIKDSFANPSSILPFLKGGGLIPRPDFAFFLNADPAQIMQRPRPADQGLDYLLSKQKILVEFAKNNDLLEIDGNKTEQEVFGEILKVISN